MDDYGSVTEMFAEEAAEFAGFGGSIWFVPMNGNTGGMTKYEDDEVIIRLNREKYGSIFALEASDDFEEVLYHEMTHGVQYEIIEEKKIRDRLEEEFLSFSLAFEGQAAFLTGSDEKIFRDAKEFYKDLVEEDFEKVPEDVYTVSYRSEDIRVFGYSREGVRRKEDLLYFLNPLTRMSMRKEAENIYADGAPEGLLEVLEITHKRIKDAYEKVRSAGNSLPVSEEYLESL